MFIMGGCTPFSDTTLCVDPHKIIPVKDVFCQIFYWQIVLVSNYLFVGRRMC